MAAHWNLIFADVMNHTCLLKHPHGGCHVVECRSWVEVDTHSRVKNSLSSFSELRQKLWVVRIPMN